MEDSAIIDLYWAREERALTESDLKYGKLCRSIAYNILHNDPDCEECLNDTYLKTSGDEEGIASYGQVCDLLVSWHIQTVVLPSITVEESQFDPYDESQIDLSGIVNAR